MHSLDLKNNAINLRLDEHMGLSRIALKLGIAKSTASLWLRSYPLPKTVPLDGTKKVIVLPPKHCMPKVGTTPELRLDGVSKVCPQCKLLKELKDFNKALHICKVCHNTYNKNWRDCHKESNALTQARYRKTVEGKTVKRNNFLANKDKIYTYEKARKETSKEYIRALKKYSVCSKCGNSNYRCLDFHHTDPSIKHSEISTMVINGRSIAAIKKELEKCIVLCKNCHAIEHWVD